ncbi:uncharacterized protein BO96DRAFT_468383 [Aspergillus niger CBS 101883]|uniref:Uncharacterized protein n=2 Tax=Aspergillus niger TaxID=5061 RepID=A2QYA5_ASPNC|nr:uncharacterized protein BO96DRAFT_468383 [Aspergillus niger CBS 101883]XP_059601758.1 hypothetical protein An12g00560 [Aspergillus niger]PYH53561.1 hypothetical protein BO96DRAFT_468383 [Aspergillus niger CBS 101883]CAK40985.1 hypothetical protein An12g00560 [Aspergillus niger]
MERMGGSPSMSNIGCVSPRLWRHGGRPGTVQPTILPSSGSILGLENSMEAFTMMGGSTTNADSLGYRESPPSLLFRRGGLSTCGPPGAQSAFNSVWDNADNAAIPVHFGIHVSNMRPIAVKRKENSLKPLPKPISEISTDTKQW